MIIQIFEEKISRYTESGSRESDINLPQHQIM